MGVPVEEDCAWCEQIAALTTVTMDSVNLDLNDVLTSRVNAKIIRTVAMSGVMGERAPRLALMQPLLS